MNLNEIIKENRIKLELSQEELADKIYVTRQSISNWENNKNYPDLKSLILMSELFDLSIDQLIKGDLKEIKEMADINQVNKMNQITKIFSILFVLVLILPVPLVYYLDKIGMIIYGVIFIACMYYALKVEKIKKDNDVQTYQEISLFMDGKKLDEIDKARESGKRMYQKVLLPVIFALISFGITSLFLYFLK